MNNFDLHFNFKQRSIIFTYTLKQSYGSNNQSNRKRKNRS